MVKLTQIDDSTAAQFEQTNNKTEKSYTDTESESESDFEDDFDVENETFYDRVVALKDIIPPQHRSQLVDVASTIKAAFNTGLSKGGNLLWAVTSSALLLGVPLSLAILAETQLQEMEKELSLQQSAQEVLTTASTEEKK